MSCDNHPKLIYQDGQVIYKFNNQVPSNSENSVMIDMNYYQWPYYYWPCCYDSGQEQTMELEIGGKKITIKGKSIKVKLEELE